MTRARPRVARGGWPARLAVALALALPAIAFAGGSSLRNAEPGELEGRWSIGRDAATDRAQLMLTVRVDGRDRGDGGRTLDPAEVRGLRADAFDAAGAVAFTIVRDAGSFVCAGTTSPRGGHGTFTFEPDAAFARQLERRGVGRPTAGDQLALALTDTGLPLLDALRDERYPTPSVATLVELAQHGVTDAFTRGLAGLGFRLGTLESLRRARDHGVTPDFIRGLRAAGYDALTFAQYQQARDHGVTPAYIASLAAAGHRDLAYDEVLRARDHGVTSGYLAFLSRAFGRLSLRQAIEARDHGVTERSLKAARRELGDRITLEQAIRWRRKGG
jgi:hypothetical protein